LRLLVAPDILSAERLQDLEQECNELIAILMSELAQLGVLRIYGVKGGII
jgi:hypothetical protein